MNSVELQTSIVDVLGAKLVPFISGPPGIGKSDIIKSIADKYNLKPIDIRLSQCDPTDLLGFPIPKNGRMEYAPPRDIPLKGWDDVPDGYKGWLLFFDEFSSASLAVQAAAFKVVLDQHVGIHSIHPKCAMVCAGNSESDGGIVNRLSTPMQSRLIHLELSVDPKLWIDWASSHDLDHRVISYIEGRPEHLHLFDPNHNDKTFASPRTWHFASKLIKGKQPNPILQQLLIGTISAGVAHEFFSYMNYCSDLPSIKDIIKRPDDIPIPDDPALLYATSHMVAAYITEDNAAALMRFVDRLDVEFAVTSIRSALRRKKELLEVDEVRNWAHKLADEIF